MLHGPVSGAEQLLDGVRDRGGAPVIVPHGAGRLPDGRHGQTCQESGGGGAMKEEAESGGKRQSQAS